MELKHLRYLIAVSEETTFIRAADRLRLAQPALSRQIHKFEREIGEDVFERGRTGVTLTPAGEICLRVARDVIDRVEKATDRARMAEAGRSGACRILVSKWAIWSGFSGRLVAHLAANEPSIRVAIQEEDLSGHWARLLDNQVDVAIGTKPPESMKAIHSESLINDVVDTAILSTIHPLAHKSSIELDELSDETLLIYDDTIVNYEDHDLFAAFKRARFEPRRIKSLPSSQALLTMVAAGQGWSVHRRSIRGRIPDIAAVPLRNFELAFPVVLLRRTDDNRRIVLTIMQRIRELAASDYPDLYSASDDENVATPTIARRSPGGHQLELRDLRYFAAVIEEQTIGRAAERLGLSQSTLSRQLNVLERDIGVPLLEREPRGIVPTAAGESLYRDSRGILDEIARLPAEVERGRRAARGVCNVAATPSNNIREILSTVLREAANRSPHLEILVQDVPTPLQPAAIHDARFDIGLCHPFTSLGAAYPDVDCRLLLNDALDGALLSIDHPLARKKKITFSDLAGVPFLFFRREFHPAFYDLMMETFRNHDYRPVVGPLQEGLATMWSLAAAGEGWCVASGAERNDPPPGTIGIPIEGFSIPWGVNLLTRRDEVRATPLAVSKLLLDAAAER